MNLENLEEIARLRDLREGALKLTNAAFTCPLSEISVYSEGGRIDVKKFANEKYLRAAISYAAEMVLDNTEKGLSELGVSMPRREASTPPTVESAMSSLKMYQNAWLRSLGGSIRNKRHFIDALVVTTEEIVEKAKRWPGDGFISRKDHDRRVTELLEHNNKMEERMREAERKLRRFMEATPAERLAFAVEQAAASTIAAIKQEGQIT